MKEAQFTEKAVETLRLTGLILEGFRNYRHAALEPNAGFHVLAGPNAQGKTSLLEAIYLISTTRLLRGMRDAEAIREGEDRFRVEGSVAQGRTSLAVTLERGGRKRALLNGVGLPRAADLIGRLPSVCITALDLPMVSGEPGERRMFLDLELSQVYPAYLRALSLYKRALEQRNALLKQAQDRFVPDESFSAWEAQMATYGASLRDYRRRFVEELSPLAAEAQAELGEGESLKITYVSRDEALTAAEYEAALVQNRRQDIARGTTTAGPHRDDLSLTIAGRDGRLYGSQGQQRSAVIAMKLGTLELMRDKLGEPPILLLDDMLSDLDAGRRARLCQWVARHAGQAFLTCTEATAAGDEILDRATVYRVQNGTLEAL
ncbi:MAG: DNA replication/repair protein RecF [Methanoregulaceae archaeon]|nr:DNA replication/repair protein RecF [Methanoregulaceae archaeon]